MRKHRRNITVINNEIDYDKLAEAIVKAQRKADEIEKTNKEQAKEKEKEEIIKKRIEGLGCADCIDENGELKSKIATLKFLWKIIKCDEECLKNVNLLGNTINGVVAALFGLIEWVMYFLSIGLILFGIIVPIYNFIDLGDSSLIVISTFITYALSAFAIFLISRLVIRTLKIECKYSKDDNYMINFLAVIVAVIAIIVSIVVR